jgi:energy-coupling factor transporter ATP-binding protein EcfA2
MPGDSQPPRILNAPLRLTAMTLRGLGPYLHGQRLEIKPLTILCGENGSGKSTWIEMLLKLRQASERPEFPFWCLLNNVEENPSARDVPDTTYSRNINGILLQPPGLSRFDSTDNAHRYGSARDALYRNGYDDEYGPPACIGLEIEIVEDWSFDVIEGSGELVPLPDSFYGDTSSSAAQFLWYGELAKKAKLRLRWAYPDTSYLAEGALPMDGLKDWIEITIGDCHSQFTTHDSDSIRLSTTLTGESRRHDLSYELAGSLVFVDEPSARTLPLPSFAKYQRNLLKCSETMNGLSNEVASAVAENFITLFRSLVRESVRGFFPIGPIRELHKREWTNHPRETTYRYVGERGEHAQALHAFWAYNLMQQTQEPLTGGIEQDFSLDDFNSRLENPALSPSHVRSDKITNQRSDRIRMLGSSDLREKLDQVDAPALRDQMWCELLNSVLPNRDLYRKELWGSLPELFDEARWMLEIGIENLPESSIRRLNRLLIELHFNYTGNSSDGYDTETCRHRTGYLFETFLSYWMAKLTGAELKYGNFSGGGLGSNWPDTVHPPNGYLIGFPDESLKEQPGWQPRGVSAERIDRYSIREDAVGGYDGSHVLWTPMLGSKRHTFSGGWHLMSTGFHQLAPIIIQSALLRQNEIMTVENPEAHLHPTLQIKVAEFLMYQANAGKIMLIETHSDLFVRRILRAIREEQISPNNVFKQSTVGINFTSVVDDPNGFQYASVEELQIDDKGQVHNWPAGFMDDDLKEADRWLQANFRSGILDESSDE